MKKINKDFRKRSILFLIIICSTLTAFCQISGDFPGGDYPNLSAKSFAIDNNADISVYPNPVIDNVNICSSKYNIVIIELLNKDGQVLKLIENINSSEYKLTITDIDDFILFAKVYTVNGVFIKKIIKFK